MSDQGSTKTSPFFLQTGRTPRIPTTLLIEEVGRELALPEEEFGSEQNPSRHPVAESSRQAASRTEEALQQRFDKVARLPAQHKKVQENVEKAQAAHARNYSSRKGITTSSYPSASFMPGDQDMTRFIDKPTRLAGHEQAGKKKLQAPFEDRMST